MEILLIRHGLAGKADPRRHPDDDLRPLTPKGERLFGEAAKGLRAQVPAPARIYASPALRTLQTARLLADRFRVKAGDLVTLDVLHHAASPAAALRALSRMRLPGRIALVGHEPWLGRFASLLISGSAGANLPLDKGGACLVAAEAMRAGAGSLAWSMTQDQLRGFAGR
jgi:phosphohistidine phosphatase